MAERIWRPCTHCGATFYQDESGARRSWCKTCRREATRKSMAKSYLKTMLGKVSCVTCRRTRIAGSPHRCLREKRPCRQCGQTFQPKVSHQYYCDSSCRERAKYEKKYRRETRTCRWCFTEFNVPHISDAVCCSGLCGIELRNHSHTWKNPDRCHIPICTDCGGPTLLPPGKQPGDNQRCMACLEKFSGRRSVAKKLGDNVHWSDIANRDNWTCHICGKKVRKNIQLSHRLAPSVDHLVPISHGGADVLENTALAHRGCNSSRGTKGTAQLRLVS